MFVLWYCKKFSYVVQQRVMKQYARTQQSLPLVTVCICFDSDPPVSWDLVYHVCGTHTLDPYRLLEQVHHLCKISSLLSKI